MDLAKLISDLRHELELVDRAIQSLTPLAATASKRRGRPPKEISSVSGIRAPATGGKTKTTDTQLPVRCLGQFRKRIGGGERQRGPRSQGAFLGFASTPRDEMPESPF